VNARESLQSAKVDAKVDALTCCYQTKHIYWGKKLKELKVEME
jgi:hypothetical protein